MPPEADAVDPLRAAIAHFGATEDQAWLVGGRVRDTLLGRWTVDTDVVVRANAMQHAARIAAAHRAAFVPLDTRRGIARVVWAAHRRGAAPRGVLDLSDAVAGDLEADLRARDFTVNALALPLDGLEGGAVTLEPGADVSVRGRPAWLPTARIIDIVGGRADLFAHRLRVIDPAALDADPLRLLRAPRLAAQLSFAIEPRTQAAIRARAQRICEPAAERVREELLRLLGCDPPEAHVELLHALGLLVPLLPELAPADDGGTAYRLGLMRLDAMARCQAGLIDRSVPAPSEAVALVTARHRGGLRRFMRGGLHGGTERAVWLRLAALLAGIGAAAPGEPVDPAPVEGTQNPRAGLERIGHRLRLGNAELDDLQAWLRWAPTVRAWATHGAGPSRRALHRYFRACGVNGVGAAMLALAIESADRTAFQRRAALAAVVDRLLTAWFERHDEIVAPVPLLDGRRLLRHLGLEPGPVIGQLLAAVLEAQAAGELEDEVQALAYARQLLEST